MTRLTKKTNEVYLTILFVKGKIDLEKLENFKKGVVFYQKNLGKNVVAIIKESDGTIVLGAIATNKKETNTAIDAFLEKEAEIKEVGDSENKLKKFMEIIKESISPYNLKRFISGIK